MRRTISSLSSVSIVVLASVAAGDASAASGGPDAFGYTFVDEDDGAVYAYVNISASGLNLGNADDLLIAPTNLGAPFPFYGETVNQLRASTNGFLTSTLGTDANFSNLCPLPAAQIGGGFRIAPLHDDLVSTVYYQYFDQAGAAAVGYPGEADGISVFQWTGQHFGGPADDFVDFEAILFHDDGAILTMVALDFENGLGSTLGIQNADASVALQYSCNLAGGTTPGATAVLYSPPPISLNEIRIDQPGADNDEYFELRGPPGTPLDGLHYIVVGDGAAGVSGFIEAVVNLNGQVIPPSGYFVAAENTFTLATEDLTAVINHENTDTTTHMIVSQFTGAVGTLIDPNFDGVVDSTPWGQVLDAIAIVDPGDLDLPYGPGGTCVDGPYCNELTITTTDSAHVFRCGDGSGGWNQGTLSPVAVPASDSPGAPNPCACGDGLVITSEACDTAGESVTCDVDCTAVVCGDGLLNATAGELCDDAGESALCDDDCTAVACGDGVANATAGEACDDAGESALCDADCTVVACGDGITNVAAGEECDDAGESATCDVDCTAAMCGDLVVNTTAGENCDDGGRSDTCNLDCSAATCGDGMVNAAAGEECDGDGMGMPGETATCDDDCTGAMCGDGEPNATAGEECDDAGESDTCDDDCTAATCGDGAINATAGEECDDSNTDDGDGCSASCVIEGEPGTSGTDSSGGDSTSGDATTGEPTGGGTLDTGVDDTAGSGGSTGGSGTGAADSSGGGPVTISGGLESSGGDDTDSDTAGVVPGDGGCGCSTASEGAGGGAGWSLLAFFGGLFGVSRRRRSKAA